MRAAKWLWWAVMLCCAPMAVGAERIPAADFFRNAVMTSAVMSPSGRHVAVLVSASNGGRRRLAVIDVKNLAASKVLAAFTDIDIATVHWVNDERLVFTVTDQQKPAVGQPGSGLFSVDRLAAEPPRQLITARAGVRFQPRGEDRDPLGYGYVFDGVLRDGTNDVVVRKHLYDAKGEPTGTALFRVDTTTVRAVNMTLGAPPNAFAYALDRQGVPRVAVSFQKDRTKVYWKPSTSAADWALLQEFDTYGSGPKGPLPFAIGADNAIYAQGQADAASDTSALLRLEVHGADVKVQPLMSLAGFDFRGELVFDARGGLLGVHYLNDALSSFWYDARLKAIQQQVDALLPSTVNLIDCGDCGDLSRVLVTSESDRQPLVFQLYDTASGKLDVLARSRPWVDPAAMAVRDMQRFAARDGLSIPVHITRPRGVTGPAPAVVLVHGGPWVRGGYWHWADESQFLASRGYVVIEPEFRGSTGFGTAHFKAGFKQWGLKMQDDLVDAANWAVAQGYADAKRICIAGASYGGYATLMGLIRDPAVFRCGVDWAGVSDIDLMYSSSWSDFPDQYKTYGMPARIGDREKDAAQIKATSPLQQASRLKRPLLMAHGRQDGRVPLDHATEFRDAIKPNGSDFEFLIYEGEGHGWMLESNKVDFWGRVERFLAKHLGAGS